MNDRKSRVERGFTVQSVEDDSSLFRNSRTHPLPPPPAPPIEDTILTPLDWPEIMQAKKGREGGS